MKTFVIITKALCYMVAGFSAVFGTSMAQYINTTDRPSNFVLGVTIVMSCGGAATGLVGFLSSSFSDYKAEVAQEKTETTDKIKLT